MGYWAQAENHDIGPIGDRSPYFLEAQNTKNAYIFVSNSGIVPSGDWKIWGPFIKNFEKKPCKINDGQVNKQLSMVTD